MKKKISLGLLALVGLLVAGLMVFTRSPIESVEAHGEEDCDSFNSELANLYAKDPQSWERVEGGYGQVDLEGGRFRANNLQPGTKYSLIIYDTVLGDDDDSEWPGEGYTSLSTGKADKCGNLNLKFKLPFCLEEAKIWLVLASDYENNMTHWNPRSYLFEHDRFTTCVPEPIETPTPTPTEVPEPTPTATPSAEIRGTTPAGAPICEDTALVLLPGNPLVWRRNGTAIVQWTPTEGNRANVYYYENQNPENAHAVRDTENDGYVEIGELGGLDWTFGVQQANGCAGGETVWIIDGSTNGWVLFLP